MSDSCCCHGHCCGLDATRLHFVLHRLNPFTYLYRLPSGQGEGGGMGTVTVPAFLPSPEDDGQKLRKAFQVMLWTMDPAERDAKLVNKALKRKGERHLWVIIEVACASSPDHLIAVVRSSVVGLGTDEDSLTRAVVSRAEIDMKKVKEEYKKRYNTTLIYDVVDDTSGDYMRFLLTLIGPADP
ncbi:hypothetical protein B296_00023323 [Ensete ventricosum]|uniref:Annexin n=1 Tax=Ensete ventricosum TaxID=4639 RepID=A0A427AJU6_ENSVE|nr:hypothetical protein B296_00023323 [Ensete ventricosum]